MRVILVYFGRMGGGPVYALEIAKKLKEKAELFCLISSQIENLKFWQEAELSFYKVPTYNNVFGFLISFFDLPKFLKICKKIKEFSPDVIYYPFFHPWQAKISSFFRKTPKVFTVHDPIIHKGERNFIIQWLQDKIIRKSKRIIILSSIFKQIIAEKGIPEENIDVIPHGIFDYYRNFRTVKDMPFRNAKQEQLTILFFGRILEYKGLGVLLRAFPLIKKRIPAVKLLIAGDGDTKPYKKLLNGLSDVKIINKWIRDEEIGEYFSAADLVVCPYSGASQSGVIPIAYMFYLPVVATKVGGLEEQVIHGLTGLLAEPDDENGLADACTEILKDEAKRKKMGEAGYEMAQREWDWEKISDKVLESLKKSIKEK